MTGPDYFACDYMGDKRKLTLEQADTYKCGDALITYELLRDCHTREKVDKVGFCDFDAKTKMLKCGENFVPYDQAQRWGCMDAIDLDRLVTWCNKRD